jgi:hypothetical protein
MPCLKGVEEEVRTGAAFLEKWDFAEWKKKYRAGTGEIRKA